MAKCYSSGNRQLEQAAAMLSPCVFFECGRLRDTITPDFGRRVSAQRCMCTRMIVASLKLPSFRSRSRAFQKKIWLRYSRRMVPMRRSMMRAGRIRYGLYLI